MSIEISYPPNAASDAPIFDTKKARVTVVDEKEKSNLCSNTTFYKVITVFGALFAIVGALALVGLLLPNAGPLTPYVEALGKFTSLISTGLGGDPLFMGIFASSLGTTLFLSGILGLALQSCSQRRNQMDAHIRDDGTMHVNVRV